MAVNVPALCDCGISVGLHADDALSLPNLERAGRLVRSLLGSYRFLLLGLTELVLGRRCFICEIQLVNVVGLEGGLGFFGAVTLLDVLS